MGDLLTLLHPLILLALFGVWAWCLVDALRAHRPWPWIIVLLFVPVLPVPFYLLNFKLSGSEDGRLDSFLRARNEMRRLEREVAEKGTVSSHLEMADAQLRAGNAVHALKSLGLVLESDPEDLQAHFLAGTAFLSMGNPERALDHLGYVMEHDQDYRRGEARLAHADALALTGRTSECLEEIRTIAGKFLLPEAIVRHARELRRCGDVDSARSTLKDMLARVREMSAEDVRRHKAWIRQGAEDLRDLGPDSRSST